MKHYKLVELLNFRISSPPHKRKYPILKIFWRWFCLCCCFSQEKAQKLLQRSHACAICSKHTHAKRNSDLFLNFQVFIW